MLVNESVKNIAVLSDIHGNYLALETCVNYALKQGIDTFLFLGDYLGELAYPKRTMKMIYDLKAKYKCYFIRGNKEDYWLNYDKSKEKVWKAYDSTTGSLFYTYSQISERDFSFFQSLKITENIKFEGMPEISLCHGSPFKVNEGLLKGLDRTYEVMDSVKESMILCGHTHIQGKITYKNKCILNPGSVGIPEESNGKTQFLILHSNNGKWVEEFISLDYDVQKVINELKEVKLNEYAPYWCLITEKLLLGGKVTHSEVLLRAMELCKEEEGTCIWPNIEEKYWERASREFGVI